MDTMVMTALIHTLSDQHITMETVIIPAADTALVRRPVTVTSVEAILIWIIGVTVCVMMNMLAHIVGSIILMCSKMQLVTTHVAVDVMDQICMTV